MDYFDKKTYLVFPTNTTSTWKRGSVVMAVENYGYCIGMLPPACMETSSAYPLIIRAEDGAQLPIRLVRSFVEELFHVAAQKPNATFKVVTCNPLHPDDAGPMFSLAPLNIILPIKYKPYVFDHEGRKWWNA